MVVTRDEIAFSGDASALARVADVEKDESLEWKIPALEERLKEVRQRGFENMQSRQIAGVHNLSVPILGPMGRVLAVLTCPYSERLDVKAAPSRDKVMDMLIGCGQEISQVR